KIDSTIWATVDVVHTGPNSPKTAAKAAVLQTESGKLFIAELYNAQGAIDDLEIESIKIKTISNANTTGWVYEDNSGNDYNVDSTVACFACGTLIETSRGSVVINQLQPGDKVLALDAGAKPIRWIGSRYVSAVEMAANPN